MTPAPRSWPCELASQGGTPSRAGPGIHPQAYVSPTATIGQDVAIYPFAYVGDHAEIGDGATLEPGAIVGDLCKVGARARFFIPHVVLYEGVTLGDRVEIHAGTVLGADGFGYRMVEGKHEKSPANRHGRGWPRRRDRLELHDRSRHVRGDDHW